MAYTNETTHYGIPLPLGSDLTTPMDYNTAMQAVDTALFESKTDSSSALQKANQLQEDLSDTKDDVTALEGRVTNVEGIQTTQGNAITQLTTDVADVRADALDMICAVDEGTAQVASVAVTKGNYFRYNDVLYIATANIAIGDTIVPNTNCRATNVGTELIDIKTGLSTESLLGSANASSDSYATIANLNEAISNVKDKYLIITVGVATTIYDIFVFKNFLGATDTHEFRTGATQDSIIVTWTGATNGGTLQLTTCTIDNVDYKTNSEAYLAIRN